MSDAIKLKKIFLSNAISQLVADNQYVSDKDIESNGEIERWGLQGWGEFCI